MSSPHYSNGRLLLKDSNSANSWYYVTVTIFESAPHIEVTQVSVTGSSAYSESVVIRAPNGAYYRISLQSLDGIVYSANQLLATPEPSYRIYLRGDDDNRYELVFRAAESDGDYYLTLIPAVVPPTTEICSPWRLVNSVTNLAPRTITPVSSVAPRSITPVSVTCVREIEVTE